MKTLLSTIVATMAFATSMAFASTVSFPMPKLNISGSIIYQNSTVTNGTTLKSTVKTISVSTASLIALLNASPTVTNTLVAMTGTNQIPAGSYFVFDIQDEDLIVTNNNGFSFNLYYYNPGAGLYYEYGDVEIYADDGTLFGDYSYNTNTSAGTEQDQTAVQFYFDDYNGNEIESYGNGTLNWTFSPVSGGTQKTSVSVNFQPAGYMADVNGNKAILKDMNISGSGSGTIPPLGELFYLYYYYNIY